MNPAELKNYYDICMTHYSKAHKRMKLLDAVDRGNFWSALKANYPGYQIFPDTNFVNYVKSNLVASIYTVAKSAEILPTSENDKEIVTNINVALDNVWELANVGFYQFQAGERAALLNMGITQVGWDKDGDMVSLKNIDPVKFMRDPFAVDLDHAGYCMTYENYHKSVFKKNDNYKEEFEKYEAKQNAQTVAIPMHEMEKTRVGSDKDNYTLFIYWVREGKKVNEYHVVNNEHLLYKKENIKPACFPFAILYCELPSGDLIGSSPASKILSNNIAYNIMDSLALTAEYKNQRPPKFISSASGLNVAAFTKYGDEADKTYVVNGFADKAVHYHQFPQPSNALTAIKMSLERNVQDISGVDGRYTGRDTGSITTTGGTEEMLNRVTLGDTPKIINYENYTKTLTKLVLTNMLEFSPKRKYFYKPANQIKWASKEVDFPKIDSETLFNYKVMISSELPKNKQRIAAMANMLMEKQMQYSEQGTQVQLITEEEWLMFQDIPNKEYMLERMGIQRLEDAVEETAQVLGQYSSLVEGGMDPNDALLATAQGLKDKRAGIAPQGDLTTDMQLQAQEQMQAQNMGMMQPQI